MFEIFSHTFMLYAFLIGLILGVGSAFLSPFLVLNRQSMIADGLSHVAFTGIIVGLLAFPSQPIYVAIPIAVLAAILITSLSKIKMIEHDSAIAVISLLSLAIGLITISVANKGFNGDIESLLTGSILSTSLSDIMIAFISLVVVGSFILLFYRPLLSLSYDREYAHFTKVRHHFLTYALSIMTAIFIVIGVRTIGMMLVSAFIIFPSLIASQFSKSFNQNIWLGLIIAFLVIFITIFLTFNFSLYQLLDVPTGPSIVTSYSVVLFISILSKKVMKKAK